MQARRSPSVPALATMLAGRRGILALALPASALYTVLALSGDLRERLPLLFAGHVLALACMLGAFAMLRRDARGRVAVLVFAGVFRALALLGEPALSDDVYRYVWDGRVALAGISPWRHAPSDPALEELRDADWARINHRDVPTVYPVTAQALFVLVAAAGGGATGMRLALAALDLAIVLVLDRWLRRSGRPPERVALYAWNPLAVLETAGSGHVEPLGMLLVLAAGLAVRRGRRWGGSAALAAAVHVKPLPLVLAPGWLCRSSRPALASGVVVAALVAPLAVSALVGAPAWPPGLGVYAEHWRHNACLFALVEGALWAIDSGRLLAPAVSWLAEGSGVEAIDGRGMHRLVWPPALARGVVLLLLAAWIAGVVRRGLDLPAEALAVTAGAVLLSPTIHPWYVLWVLPWAALTGSRGGLALAALVPLAYVTARGDVPAALRLLEFVPVGLLFLADLRRAGGSVGRSS